MPPAKPPRALAVGERLAQVVLLAARPAAGARRAARSRRGTGPGRWPRSWPRGRRAAGCPACRPLPWPASRRPSGSPRPGRRSGRAPRRCCRSRTAPRRRETARRRTWLLVPSSICTVLSYSIRVSRRSGEGPGSMLLQLEVGPAFGPGAGTRADRTRAGTSWPAWTAPRRGRSGAARAARVSGAVAPVDAAVAAGQDQCGKRRHGLGPGIPRDQAPHAHQVTGPLA